MSFTIRYLFTAQPSKKERGKKTKQKRGMRRREGDYRGDKGEGEEREEKEGCGVREQQVKSFSYGDTPNLSLWHELCSTTHEPHSARVTFPTTTHADFRIVNTTLWTTQSELTLCTTIRGCTCTSKHRQA